MRRNPDEQTIALECLRLANNLTPPAEVVDRAEQYYAFVTGDDARSKLDAVVKAVS